MPVAELERSDAVPVISLQQFCGESSFHFLDLNGGRHPGRELFLRPHRKNYYMIALLESGESRHWVDGKAYSGRPGCIYIGNPQQVHVKEERGTLTGPMVCFTPDALPTADWAEFSVLRNPANLHELFLPEAEFEWILQSMKTIRSEAQAHDRWRRSGIAGGLQLLLSQVSRIYDENSVGSLRGKQPSSLVRRFQDLVSRHYAEWATVRQYSRHLGVTPGHLSDRIRKDLGRSPLALIQERRILEAQRLLVYTDSSIRAIARQLHFAEEGHFSRTFRRLVDSSPSDYRKVNRRIDQ